MHTKLQSRSKVILVAILGFTVLASLAFLMPSTKLPSVRINGPLAIDKIVHAGIHFVLVLGWLLYANSKAKLNFSLFLIIITSCVGYGILIEVLQYITKTRGAELADIYANLVGTGLGTSLYLVYKAYLYIKY